MALTHICFSTLANPDLFGKFLGVCLQREAFLGTPAFRRRSGIDEVVTKGLKDVEPLCMLFLG